MKRARGFVPFAAGVAAALAALVLYNAVMPRDGQITQRDVGAIVAQAMASATPPPPYSVFVREAIRPSLVLIQTESAAADDDPEAEPGKGLGTGVVVSDRGDILTSLHVVEGRRPSSSPLPTARSRRGEVVAAQPENDIAVLRAIQPPPTLVPATLGNPNAMRVGDEAFVVGQPARAVRLDERRRDLRP